MAKPKKQKSSLVQKSINEDFQKLVIQQAIPQPNMMVKIPTNQIQDYLYTLTYQTTPFLKNKKLPIYQNREQYNICDTTPIFFKNGKQLPTDEVQAIARYCEDILKDIPEMIIYTPFQEGILSIDTETDIYYRRLFHNEKQIGYQIHVMTIVPATKQNIQYYFNMSYQLNIEIPTSVYDEFSFHIKHAKSGYDIYQTIIPQQLGWNQFDKDTFLKTKVQLQDESLEKYTYIFCTHLMVINALLYQQKNKIQKMSPASLTQPLHIYLPKTGPVTKKTCVHLHIKDVNQFAKTPILRKTPNTIHYQTPKWQVRGHVRHYKNGKTVYIQPSVRKRKKMEHLQTDQSLNPKHITFQP